MKKLLTLLTAAVGAANVFGTTPTPVAVWDGDFTATQTGFTLNRSGNAISQDNSTITIDQSVGVKVDFDSAMTSGMTVMFRYADLNLANATNVLAASFVSGGDENRTGVCLVSGTVDNAIVGSPYGIWNTGFWPGTGSTKTTANVTSAMTSGVMVFTYYKVTDGTSLYRIADGTRTTIYRCAGLGTGNDTAINGCTIGGERAKSGATLLSAATGMKITGIAIFDGILTEAEMTGYVWPSETQTINVSANTSVSAINAQYDSTTYKAAKVTVASGVTITVDAAFNAKIQSVSSTGSITLSAVSQPDASYNLANVDFSGVQGGLLRSWLTPGVVGFNFYKNRGNDTTGALATGTWYSNGSDRTGTSTEFFSDGLSVLSWNCATVYSQGGYYDSTGEEGSLLNGYLDDGSLNGHGVEISLSNVPYATYDVIIYCASDTNPADFKAKTVNGKTYTWDSTTESVVEGSANWGKAALGIPVYGVNALRIRNLSGPLSIYGLAKDGTHRGGISAIQIMPPATPDNIRTYTLTLNGTATSWSSGTWTLEGNAVEAPTSGYVEIVASASTELTIDTEVRLADLKVSGGEDIVVTVATNGVSGSLYAIKATVLSGVLKQGSAAILGATPSIIVEGGATFDLYGLGVNAANKVYIAGDGAGSWPWALTSSNGAGGAILGGLYVSTNATIGGANELKIGQTGAGYSCYLQGFTLTKTGAGALTGTNMNTPGTGTIDVQGGAMSVNQWNNLNNNSGDTTVILHSGTSLANGTDRIVPMGTLKLLGGTLSTASKAFRVKTLLTGSGETANLAFADGASASLTGDLTVTAALTLDGAMTFSKDATAASDVVVTASGTLTASGVITVGAGVTFNVGVNRPTGMITVEEGGTLAAQLQNTTDIIELTTSSQPANVILYDANGNVVSNPRTTYSNGTLIIMPPVPTLEASGTVAFDTAANWVDSAMPGNEGDAIIELSDDATITVSGTYMLGSLIITGSGVATFSGSGTITVGNISVRNGATFVRNVNVSATTGIDLASGTVLRINGVTESAVLSGAGAVETYGAVTFSTNNTFTGGLTIKSGSTASTTTYGGFAGKKDDGTYPVTVEDGGCLDISNTGDTTHSLTIAGKGILVDGTYSGAVKKSSGVPYGIGSRQTKSITLTADAVVDVSTGWGIVRSAHNEATLALNGHTLTISGSETFPMAHVNASSSSGKIVLEGVTLQIGSSYASNLTGVEIIANGGSTVNFATAPTAVGAVTVAPSATASVNVQGYANITNVVVPVVKTVNVDSSNLTAGSTITLMTTDAALTENENVTIVAGSRYTTTVSGQNVTATVVSGLPAPFLHYDFNAANSIASDSPYNFGNLNPPTFVSGRNGTAGVFDSSYKPYYDSNTSGKSPFYAGEMTVTTLLKVREANNTILWNFGSGWNNGMALIAKDSSTLAVVSWTGGVAGSDVVSVSGIGNLMNKWHLVTIVADANGTTLYIDGQSATSATVLPSTISGQGQFGSIHGTAKDYTAVSGDGFLLDDWCVYDAALTADEIRTLGKKFMPAPLVIRIR